MNSRRDPARWRLVQSALDGLIDLPVHERDAALRTLATQDTALADEVAENRQKDEPALFNGKANDAFKHDRSPFP